MARNKHKKELKNTLLASKKFMPKRNGRHYDIWSLIHLFMGVFFGLITTPLTAMFFLVLWEPIEILLISPLLARYKITFGYEALNNSLSDIAFDALGVLVGFYILRAVLAYIGT